MPRFSKTASLELMIFAKKMFVRADYFDRASTSAFEFARQMGSKNLKKANPAFDFTFLIDNEDRRPASLRAEFVNGQVWETETGAMTCNDLRNEVWLTLLISELNEYLFLPRSFFKFAKI